MSYNKNHHKSSIKQGRCTFNLTFQRTIDQEKTRLAKTSLVDKMRMSKSLIGWEMQ